LPRRLNRRIGPKIKETACSVIKNKPSKMSKLNTP